MIFYIFNPVIKYSTDKYTDLKWAFFFDNSSSIKFHNSPSLSSINLGISELFDKLDDRNISLQPYSFDSEIRPLKGKLNGSGQTTNLGNIAEFIALNKNELAGTVIISDGIATEGVEPLLLFKNLGLKLHTLGIGSRDSQIDIFINSINAPTVAIKNERINLSAEIQSIGELDDRVSVSLYDDSKLIASKYLKLFGFGSSSVVNFQFQPKSLGRQKYRIQVSSIADEVNIINNRQSFDVLILKEKYKVALFTGSPNKNTGIIKKTLKNNSRIEVDHYLKISSNKFSLPIKNFWESAYDLILFENYPIEPLPPNFVRILAKKIISQQTGIMLVAGPNQKNKSLKGLDSILGFKAQEEKDQIKELNYWDFTDNFIDSENFPPINRIFSISSTENEVKDIAVFESGWTLLSRNIKKRIRSIVFTSPDLNKLYFYNDELNVFSKTFSESINWLLRSGVSTENYFRMNRDYFQQGEVAYLSGTKVGAEDSLGFYVDIYRGDEFILSSDFDINIEKKVWEANFRTPIPGNYSYKIYSKNNKDLIQHTSFNVLDSQIEISQVYLNDRLLREISFANNGQYFDWDEREKIFDEISQKGKREIKANMIIFKDNIALLSLLLTFLIIEWILRKNKGIL
tara:strand:- start:162 stop:2045 length:1884 start_codon:yes stop_codon:yes gene_type:complete